MREVAALVLSVVAACDVEGEVRGGLYDLGTLLEPLCFKADCGQVFQCTLVERGAETVVEYCWRDDDSTELESAIDAATVETAYCVPSPRGGSFGMPCLYSCPPPAHGCNSFHGCFCG
jgi:hypothetical protein